MKGTVVLMYVSYDIFGSRCIESYWGSMTELAYMLFCRRYTRTLRNTVILERIVCLLRLTNRCGRGNIADA